MLKQMLTKTLMICALAILTISQLAHAQISEFKMLPSDGAEFDFFGKSVSISGGYAILGAPGDDAKSGSAYIFNRSGTTWVQEDKLIASDGANQDEFGGSVSISGDYAVAGAIHVSDNGMSSGAAYVFKRSGTSWAQEAKLLPSDGVEHDVFGYSVSISGDYVVVGAYGGDNGEYSGSAYVFKRTGTTWAQEDKLLPSDGAEMDYFGNSVSISGDYVIVGAYGDDAQYDGYWQGSAYIFKRSGTSWAQEDKLLASDGDENDEFGWAVSISGDYAIVGALLDNDKGTFSGSAYVFKRSGTSWTQEEKLLPSDYTAQNKFGYSVSISGDNAIVGTEMARSAYIFNRSGTSWTQATKLLASNVEENWNFGFSVSISGDYALVGSHRDRVRYFGAAYAYNGFIPSILINVPGDQSTIQAAIDIATDGDTVLVQPGTYTENINFNGKNIIVGSLFLTTQDTSYISSTIIDGNQNGSVVTFASGEGENSKLVGFTLTNGSGTVISTITNGGGIYCIDSSPKIAYCKIIDNTATSSAGGLYLSGSSPIIDHCTISGNTAGASTGGLKLENSSSPRITYCVITGNLAPYGGGMSIYSGSSPWIINCTFSGNYATIQGGGLYVHGAGTAPIMVNSILWDNAAASSGQEIYICCGPAMTIKHSDINSSDITGSVTYLSDNVNIDPLFVSPLPAGAAPIIGGDYHLTTDSPVIDVGVSFYKSGSDTLVNLTPVEYDGSAPDLGAFEIYIYSPELAVSSELLDFGYVLVGDTTIDSLSIKNTGTDTLDVSSIAITGVESLSFVADTTPFKLAPGDSLILDVSFTPDESGSFSASLDIDSDGGDASVILTGSGIGPLGDYALEFDGTDDYVNCGNDNGLDYNGGLTISTWLKFDEADTKYLIVSQNPGGYNFRIKENNEFSLTHWENWAIESSGADLVPDTWYHLAVTYDETKVTFYKNGHILNEVSQTGSIAAGGTMYIGRYGSPAENWFNGTIDEVRIWNFARTQEEIQTDLGRHLDGNDEGLVAYWRMDEGSGQTLLDYSNNGNVGQLGSTDVADNDDPMWLDTNWPLVSPILSVFPDSLDFGDVINGETKIDTLSIKNTGTDTLNVSSIAVKGVDSLNFSVDTITFKLAPGDSHILDVSFISDTTKIFNGSLDIVSDGGNVSVSFIGNGIAPDVSVTPSSIDFGDVLMGEKGTEPVLVSNIGTANLNVSLISFTGVDSMNFSIDTTHFLLAIGDSLYIEVSFSPNTSGNSNASMVIESDGGTVEISLSGYGINPAPSIVSILDVLEDQGGWVYLSWESSMFDTVGDITQYGVWELNPDDEWVSLGHVPAIQEEGYIYLAHTFGDSTNEGIFWSTFKVTAHTNNPEVYYTSIVDSGYSMDNLVPAVPTGLLASVTGENTVILTWDPPIDEDFNYFKIYRSLTTDFDPTGMEPFAETIDTTFIDIDVEIGQTYFYILSAKDFNGNESDYSDEVSSGVLSLDEIAGIPEVFALRQNYPNPFNPITSLRFDLPEDSFINITVYDMLGRKVKTLVNQTKDAGYKTVIWNATNDRGKPVSAGVYLYQIQAGEFVQTRKMVLLK